MPAPGPLELALCAAAAWALLALVALAFRTRAWGGRALHAPQAGDAAAGAGGQPWLDLLRGMPARHKVLFADQPAATRDGWAEQGIALAYDGMEIEL